MLDFYYLFDTEPLSEYPDESRYIDGISIQEFKQLIDVTKYIRDIGFQFEYFSDNRIDATGTQKALHFISEYLKNNKNANENIILSNEKLKNILTVAVTKKAGIVCYSD